MFFQLVKGGLVGGDVPVSAAPTSGSFFLYPTSAINYEPNYPSSEPWSNITNVYSDNGSEASNNANNNQFGVGIYFTNNLLAGLPVSVINSQIPSDKNISGIECYIQCRKNSTSNVVLLGVGLTNNNNSTVFINWGGYGEDPPSQQISASASTYIFGSPTNNYGLNKASFSTAKYISIYYFSWSSIVPPGGTFTAYVDYMALKIYWS